MLAESELSVRLGAKTVVIHCLQGSLPRAEMLSRWLRSLDIERYIHTHKIRLSNSEPSHSHPILTIHTSHVTPDRLPAVFIHEQMHWAFARRQAAARATLIALRENFGHTNLDLLHIGICRMEMLSLSELIGAQSALRMIASADRYHGEYELATTKGEDIDADLADIDRWVDR